MNEKESSDAEKSIEIDNIIIKPDFRMRETDKETIAAYKVEEQ